MEKPMLQTIFAETLKGDGGMRKGGEEILELLGGGGTDFFEEVFKEELEDRRIIINDGIDAGCIEKVALQILKFNREDKGKNPKSRQPIYLYINSSGGSVFDGDAVISVIEQSKTPVYGVTLGYSCSMGLQIFLACHKRIAFKDSVLLLHDGSLSVESSGKKAKNTMAFYESLDERLKKQVLEKTTMTAEEYDACYGDETWMFADEAKAKGFVDEIIGVDIDMDSIL